MGQNRKSDDITSKQNTAASPTRAIAELVQEMRNTILLWYSCLHLGHMGYCALLKDTVLSRNTQAEMRVKPQKTNEQGCLVVKGRKLQMTNKKIEVY